MNEREIASEIQYPFSMEEEIEVAERLRDIDRIEPQDIRDLIDEIGSQDTLSDVL